jgi:hypothetical protein
MPQSIEDISAFIGDVKADELARADSLLIELDQER